MIEKIVGLVDHLTPTALIGAGGIGKTSVALIVLHNDRIKQRFGDNRWFIRCDQFPTSAIHFLSQLSKVIGAGIENLEDLTPLCPFLSSREMLIVLDNAESILDPKGMDAEKIYGMVEELSQFNNICLCITSRITTIPSGCTTLDIPTLSMEAAHDTFYHIYKNNEQPDLVGKILEQLEFHPLSVAVLATVAYHNKWDIGRLAREWEGQRTALLHILHNKSLAVTIELSLTSPMFKELGPGAQGLLGVVAFFPQGINENNLNWLLPTISGRSIFDKFCNLSLTYQSNGFITMLAPLRDHICPKDPKSSPLLIMIKEHYLKWLSAWMNPNDPGFGKNQWIVSEDVNVEHLLDVFTSVDANSDDIWDACAGLMRHLDFYKPRLTMLGPKIEGLPDGHYSKPECLFWLSQLFNSIGNHAESKRLLTHTLELQKKQGNVGNIARSLMTLASINHLLGLPKEGIEQAEEALGMYKQLNNVTGQAYTLLQLAQLLLIDEQLDSAEEAAFKAINLLPDEGSAFEVCSCQHVLGYIYHSKGMPEIGAYYLRAALEISSSFNWPALKFGIYLTLAHLFFEQGRPDDAYTHIECAKLHVANDMYSLGWATRLQAQFLYYEQRLEEAKSEALHALSLFEKLGDTQDMEECRTLINRVLSLMDQATMVSSSE